MFLICKCSDDSWWDWPEDQVSCDNHTQPRGREGNSVSEIPFYTKINSSFKKNWLISGSTDAFETLLTSSPLSPPPHSQLEGEMVTVRTDSPCHFYLTRKQALVDDVKMAGPSGVSPGDRKMGIQGILGAPPKSKGIIQVSRCKP